MYGAPLEPRNTHTHTNALTCAAASVHSQYDIDKLKREDVHVIAALIMDFLVELRNPLLTYAAYTQVLYRHTCAPNLMCADNQPVPLPHQFIAAQKQNTKAKRIVAFRAALGALPTGEHGLHCSSSVLHPPKHSPLTITEHVCCFQPTERQRATFSSSLASSPAPTPTRI